MEPEGGRKKKQQKGKEDSQSPPEQRPGGGECKLKRMVKNNGLTDFVFERVK